MSDGNSVNHPEIVIVRRRSVEDLAAGKGGAWKIAYADFVTAMMAFFLVMWLINASNEETRAQVASYFNPIKLTDTSTGARGLKERNDSKAAQAPGVSSVSEGIAPSKADAAREAALMADPPRELERIAGSFEKSVPPAFMTGDTPSKNDASRLEPADPGIGDTFDPFTPKSELVTHRDPGSGDVKGDPPANKQAADKSSTSQIAKTSAENSADTAKPEQPKQDSGSAAIPKTQTHENSSMESGTAKPGILGSQNPAAQRASEAAQITAEIAAKLGSGIERLPESVEVRITDEGTLISLTDRQSFGMFKTGSAEPEPQLIELVGAIASVLSNRPGYVVIRGHTDSRPYRNKRYDNWQLSTARAHFAQYMLVRGGLDEARIRKIEGLADREPKNSADPQAPENRRIEILLGTDGT